MKLRKQKEKKIIVRDKQFIALEKLKNNSLKNLTELKREIVIDKIFNKDTFYVRSYQLFTESNLTQKQFNSICLKPKLQLPKIKKCFLTMSETFSKRKYNQTQSINNSLTTNEHYYPQKPKNLTKINLKNKYHDAAINKMLQNNLDYKPLIMKPRINKISLSLKI